MAVNADSEHTRVAEVGRYLEGMRFPANKYDLVEHAVEHQAPSYVVNVLQQLQTPEFGSSNDTKFTVYNSVDELMRELEKVD